MLSVEPSVLEAQTDFHEMVVAWIDIALGDDELPDRDDIVKVLELVCFASIIGTRLRQRDRRVGGQPAGVAARLLIRPRINP